MSNDEWSVSSLDTSTDCAWSAEASTPEELERNDDVWHSEALKVLGAVRETLGGLNNGKLKKPCDVTGGILTEATLGKLQVPDEFSSAELRALSIAPAHENEVQDEVKPNVEPTWVAVLCMQRAFKYDYADIRDKLQESGALVLCYKNVDNCLEWHTAVPETLKEAPCIFVCDHQTKTVAELLVYRTDPKHPVITAMVLLNVMNATASDKKTRQWTQKMEGRLPFPLSITTTIESTINLVLETVMEKKGYQGKVQSMPKQAPDLVHQPTWPPGQFQQPMPGPIQKPIPKQPSCLVQLEQSLPKEAKCLVQEPMPKDAPPGLFQQPMPWKAPPGLLQQPMPKVPLNLAEQTMPKDAPPGLFPQPMPHEAPPGLFQKPMPREAPPHLVEQPMLKAPPQGLFQQPMPPQGPPPGLVEPPTPKEPPYQLVVEPPPGLSLFQQPMPQEAPPMPKEPPYLVQLRMGKKAPPGLFQEPMPMEPPPGLSPQPVPEPPKEPPCQFVRMPPGL